MRCSIDPAQSLGRIEPTGENSHSADPSALGETVTALTVASKHSQLSWHPLKAGNPLIAELACGVDAWLGQLGKSDSAKEIHHSWYTYEPLLEPPPSDILSRSTARASSVVSAPPRSLCPARSV